ncbi:hypothetical protein GOBAR_AA07616 [Gossypium barbadense]|uniref:Uncharacterized protein n=1 Tax=Gossypium barbadense TaxID=3634 RepID=A0A2P5YBN9_GOSBA|nr:hypothetical protein GOBAR_AA07616 [Gossypium barbadense]
MEKSSGVESLRGDKISFLAEEFVQSSVKSSMVVPSDTGMLSEINKKKDDGNAIAWTSKSRYEDGMFKSHNEANVQEEGSVMENIERLNGIDNMLEDKSKSVKKTSWKRIRPRVMMNQDEEESVMR